MRRATTIALAAASALLVAGCGSDQTDTAASSTAPGSHGSAADSGTSAAQEPTADASPSGVPDNASGEDASSDGLPAFPTSPADQSAKPVGDYDLVLTDVRTGRHEGFDRIVLEFSGSGEPGWQVGWVDRAVADGSGEAVPLDGDAVLAVVARGTTYPAEGAEQYDGPRTLDVEGGAGVRQVAVVGTFEGDTQVFAGVDGGQRPVRVLKLADPARLVVDVPVAG